VPGNLLRPCEKMRLAMRWACEYAFFNSLVRDLLQSDCHVLGIKK
jgi:hypothetical protein